MVLQKKDRKITNFFDCLEATQLLNCTLKMVLQKKDCKIANFFLLFKSNTFASLHLKNGFTEKRSQDRQFVDCLKATQSFHRT